MAAFPIKLRGLPTWQYIAIGVGGIGIAYMLKRGFGGIGASSAEVSETAPEVLPPRLDSGASRPYAENTVTTAPVTEKPRITQYSATPATITEGAQSRLVWYTSGADDVTIEPLGSVATSGALNVQPFVTTLYRLAAKNAAGTSYSTVNIVVNPRPVATTPQPAPSRPQPAPAPQPAPNRPQPTPTPQPAPTAIMIEYPGLGSFRGGYTMDCARTYKGLYHNDWRSAGSGPQGSAFRRRGQLGVAVMGNGNWLGGGGTWYDVNPASELGIANVNKVRVQYGLYPLTPAEFKQMHDTLVSMGYPQGGSAPPDRWIEYVWNTWNKPYRCGIHQVRR